MPYCSPLPLSEKFRARYYYSLLEQGQSGTMRNLKIFNPGHGRDTANDFSFLSFHSLPSDTWGIRYVEVVELEFFAGLTDDFGHEHC